MGAGTRRRPRRCRRRRRLVDDRHFLVAGFGRSSCTRYLTESDGKRVGVFPIDERLRYLIPFRPPEETAEYLRDAPRSRATRWRSSPTTARSSAAGRARRSGSTRRAGSTGSASRSASSSTRATIVLSTLARRAARGAVRRARLPADGVLPRDGGVVAAARAAAAPRRTREGSGQRADRGPRRLPGARVALAPLPGEVSRVQPHAQDDGGALDALPRAGRPAGGAPRDRHGRSATTPTGMASSAGSTCRTCGMRSGTISPWPRAGFGRGNPSRGRRSTSTGTGTARSGSTRPRSRSW